MSTKPSEVMALETLGEIVDYRQAKLGPKFAQQVLARQAVDEEIKELEEKKSAFSEEILHQLAQTGLKSVQVEDYRPTIVDQDRASIDRDTLVALLLESGMTATVIGVILQKATKTSHSTYLRVFDVSKCKVRGKEKKAGAVPIRKGR